MVQRSITEHQTSIEISVPIPPEEIKRTLERILNSRHFSQAPKKRKFVQLICDYHLAGRAKEINEHLIGLEVYERSDRYSPAEDPVVRVAAHDVRKRLEQYYLHEGRNDEVRLEIPIGSYEPVFKHSSDVPAEIETHPTGSQGGAHALVAIQDRSTQPAQSENESRRGRLALVIGALAAVAIILITINVWRKNQATGSTAEQDIYSPVWGPFFSSQDPTIQVLSNPPVYVLVNKSDPDVLRKNSIELSKESSKELFDLLKQTGQNEPEYLAPPKLYLSPVSHTGIGEAIGAHLITSLFRSRGLGITLKQSRNLTGEDLKDRNLIMLGGRWSNAWAGKMPVKEEFYFTPQISIANPKPQPGEESEYMTKFDEQTGQILEDYAMITVKPSAQSKNVIMALEGLRGVGTGAAAELITNKIHLAEINQRLRRLAGPNGLPRYYQILLKAEVENNVATKLSPVAVHKIEDEERRVDREERKLEGEERRLDNEERRTKNEERRAGIEERRAKIEERRAKIEEGRARHHR
ncbi:MAG TPA: hypothetical protein VFV58_27885 [Blastocatellia bacterium]|jgi:hypothetical protein|nr:hypothetical protein [Blastocatellia bacterium]